MKKILFACLILMFAWLPTADAQMLIFPGNTTFNGNIEINYNANGTWNRFDGDVAQGIKYLGTDFSAPGTPWQQVTIGFNGQEIKGNYAWGGTWEWSTPAGVDVYAGSAFGSITTWFVEGENESFVVVKEEKMCRGGHTVKMNFSVTNLSDVPLERFSLIHGVDPDQDYPDFSNYATQNDVEMNGHLAIATGVNSGLRIGYGLCDSYRQMVGFTNWSGDALPTLFDSNGDLADTTIHCLTQFEVVPGLQSRKFQFFVLFGSGHGEVEARYERALSCCCDLSNPIELPEGPDLRRTPFARSIAIRVLKGEISKSLTKELHVLRSPINITAEKKDEEKKER